MIETVIDLEAIAKYRDVSNLPNIDDYIRPNIERTVATEKIKWTVEGFEEAWQKYINIHSLSNHTEEKEKFYNVVKLFFSHQPEPEFLILKFKDITETETHCYKNNFVWARAVYKKVLVLQEATAP